MGQTIELKAADGQLVPAYLAPPAGPARGAVVVLQEIFGVNRHIRAVADGFAGDGYLALAPALFQRLRAGVELGYEEADVKAGLVNFLLVPLRLRRPYHVYQIGHSTS